MFLIFINFFNKISDLLYKSWLLSEMYDGVSDIQDTKNIQDFIEVI